MTRPPCLKAGLVASAALLLACTKETPPPPPAPELEPIGAGLPEQTFEGFPDCTHPAVDPDCAEGWCRIPAGCFIMGSPVTEWGRGAASEDEVAVTLTHSFFLQQYELTQTAWMKFGVTNPSSKQLDGSGLCLEGSCPVGGMNWFESVAFANLMSERHEPPLAACYRLLGCTGELGAGMKCTGFELTAPSSYECEGYRLPTEAEWEYAARAGTRSAFYSGDITPQLTMADCYDEPVLNSVAWYCANSDRTTHVVGRKRPNGWGLFDMLGNVSERVHDTQTGDTAPGPLVDPGGDRVQQSGRLQRGGNYGQHGRLLRAASGAIELSWDFVIPGEGVGIRLVRTAPE